MAIVNVSLSHRGTPGDMLEKLAVPSAQLGGVLARLQARPAIASTSPAGSRPWAARTLATAPVTWSAGPWAAA